jgi:ProP effector
MTNKDFKKTDYLQTLDWLMTYFPNTFSRKPKEVKPLKIGILEDIYLFYDTLKFPEVDKQAIKQAIQHYSASTVYLSCQKEDQARIDLYGQEVGVVNKEQAKYAQERYEQKMVMRQTKPNETNQEPQI